MIPSVSPPTDLFGRLGISMTELAAIETPDTLHCILPVDSLNVARLDPETVRAFAHYYGDLATVEIRTGDLTELVIDESTVDSVVAEVATAAQSGGPYQAVITVDKALLAQRLSEWVGRPVRVFLFGEALSRALKRGISWFEAEVWTNAPAPLVIAVLDTDVCLTGAYLAVVGLDALSQIPVPATKPISDLEFDAIRQVRDRLIGWDTPWVRALTPWHFELRGTCADSDVHGALRAQLAKLAVLFTCDRARQTSDTPGEIVAEYRGREYVASLAIDERAPLICTQEQSEAVMEVVDWCYERRGTQGQPDWVSDRLPFVQTRVAQSIGSYGSEARLLAFAQVVPYLIEGIRWHWKAFIEGKVNEYLDREEQVETAVSEAVATFGGESAALVKALTETILAAVAVLIGSFIAAAFATPFNGTLFRIGVLTYAGYVVIFPGAIGLFSATTGLRVARSEFDIRIQRFKQMLEPSTVSAIVGDRVSRAQNRYYRWLAVAASAYLTVAIAAGVAATQIPDLVTVKP